MARSRRSQRDGNRVRDNTEAYARNLASASERGRQISSAGRDIGKIPNIKNVRRRNSTRENLRRFCEVYIPEAFTMRWSDIHLNMIERMEEAVLHGALYGFAMPRGSGKSTVSRAGGLWAISHNHCNYLYMIGANNSKAIDTLDALKTWMRFLPVYAEDFPEIAGPIRAIDGIAIRAKGMISEGDPVLAEWGKELVRLPTVKAPDNLRGFRRQLAPTSGAVIAVSGLTGDGIRGSLKTNRDGSQIRPDFVLLDDPQSDESASSASQNETREKLLSGAVLGMAGPGQSISAVMPCTVIKRGDMVDNILDRSKHPLWRGTRTKMINGWPERMELWEDYFQIYQMNALLEPPDYSQANRFYRRNRAKMDRGAEATWPQRKLANEVSGIQHAMNLYCRDPITFFSEYQNDPMVAQEESEFLNTMQMMEKQHPQGRNKVPLEVETIKAFIDVQKEQFFVVIMGFSDRFDGYVLDYFPFPAQPSEYFTKASLANTLTMNYPNMGLEARIYAGLNDLLDLLFLKSWSREDDGFRMSISRIGIDSRYKTSTLRRVYRDSSYRERLTLCMGIAYGAKRKPITQKVVKAGDRKGSHWFYAHSRNSSVRTLDVDVSWWKTFIGQRFATALNDNGSFSSFQVSVPQKHRLFAEHLTGEYRVTLEGPYGKADEWDIRPGVQDVDYLDCTVGCAAIASFDGLKMVGADVIERGETQPDPVDWGSWGFQNV